jgi:hypothetical protein
MKQRFLKIFSGQLNILLDWDCLTDGLGVQSRRTLGEIQLVACLTNNVGFLKFSFKQTDAQGTPLSGRASNRMRRRESVLGFMPNPPTQAGDRFPGKRHQDALAYSIAQRSGKSSPGGLPTSATVCFYKDPTFASLWASLPMCKGPRKILHQTTAPKKRAKIRQEILKGHA